VLTACADPYDWPYSQQNGTPPGFDVEIFQQMAKLGGMRAEMYWADTGTRGGLARAFRNSIFAKRCDIFLGLSDNGDDEMLQKRLVFTKPDISLGYVLVVQGKADGLRSLQHLKENNLKVGCRCPRRSTTVYSRTIFPRAIPEQSPHHGRHGER
jgi:hypothetical protein